MLVMFGLKMLLRLLEMLGLLIWRFFFWDMFFGIRLVVGGMVFFFLGRIFWDKVSSWRGRVV